MTRPKTQSYVFAPRQPAGSAASHRLSLEKAHTQESGTTFQTTSALRTDTEATREYVAQIRAVQHIELRALESGYLDGIFVDEGQAVKKGQHMFQIRPALYKAEQRKAQAEASVARIEFENARKLATAMSSRPLSWLSAGPSSTRPMPSSMLLAFTSTSPTSVRPSTASRTVFRSGAAAWWKRASF